MAIGVGPDGYINPGTEWDISLFQNNDNTVVFQLANGPVPQNLTGWTLTMYLKASAQASDASAFVNTPIITSVLLGEFTILFPAAQVADATNPAAPFFYHVDGYESTVFPYTTTLVFGTVTVLPM